MLRSENRVRRMLKLLIVDDSALMRKCLGDIFKAEGDFEISFARNGAEALSMARSIAPDVITLDVNMPEMDGITCLSRIMVECPKPVVMVSSITGEGAEVTLQALSLGAVDFIPKPDGTVSLHIDKIKVALVAKVRGAARARISKSRGLLDRVRHRAQSIEDVKRWEARHGAIPAGAFVALRTDWSKRWPDDAAMQNRDAKGLAHYPGWSKPVLQFLYETRKITASGHETTDTDPGLAVNKDDYSLESYILGTNHYQIELLANLDKVPEAGALVMVSFPKPVNGTGFPARVVALVPKS